MKMKIKKILPNIITSSRIFALILGFIFFIKGKIVISILLYVCGALSDMLDGYLARKFDAYSKFGQYLDAVSDKLFALSIIIISIIYGNYLVIIPAIMELMISIINYMIIKNRKKVYTERVGKFKTTILFVMMIVSLLSIKIKGLYYVFLILLILNIYFEWQTINAYINQLRGKSKEVVVSFKGKRIYEKIELLIKEFIYYLLHPVKIIKYEEEEYD